MQFSKKILGIAAGAVIAAVLFSWKPWQHAADAPPEFALPVTAAKVEARPLRVTLDAVGSLRANESVVLRPEVAGRITEIAFTEGQPVKVGDKLFQIDDRVVSAELKQAEANLQLARLDFERFRKLSGTGAATKQRYDQAQANLGVMEANAQLARTKLEYSTIRAPFDGVVGLRNVSVGELVAVGQELANFVSYDPMKVDFTIPETQASQLAVGQQIEVKLEALPNETFTGNVFALDSQLDDAGRAVALRATIPNPDGKLRPGYFARISLTVAEKESALIVPEDAVVPQGDAKLVFIIKKDGSTEAVPVQLGQRLKGEVEVVSGLKEGQQVITSGHMKLRPGTKVQVIDPNAKPPADKKPKE